jgi:(p)ppGpp synthase/HD superfamily hydrolase
MKDVHCWEAKFETCIYSDKLLKKLLLINKHTSKKIDFTEVKKAIYYAKKYHGIQKRQSGEPYYSHPLEVAYLIAEHRFTTDVLVASILHDTIEDTALTKEMIDYIFGSIIASQVEDLTRIKINEKISAAETVRRLLRQHKDDLLLIKYFDRMHNMQTINAKTPEKTTKIIDETFKVFISLGIYFKAVIPGFLKDETMLNLCYRQSPTKQQYSSPDLIEIFEDDFQLPFPTFQND